MTTALARDWAGDQHGVDVVEVAVGEDAGEIVAGHRHDERHRAGGDHQLVVGLGDAVVGGHRLGGAVDRRRPCALVEGDAVLDVPGVAVDDDVARSLFSPDSTGESMMRS